MESISPKNPLSLISHKPPASPSAASLTKLKAATVQLLVSQPDAARFKTAPPLADAGTTLAIRKTEHSTSSRPLGNDERQFGPQYRFNADKEMPSGPVWELDSNTIIGGVDYGRWPQQLSPAQIEAYFQSGRAIVLNTVPDNPAIQQDSRRTVPNLKLLLPENATKASWLTFLKLHREEDALAQAFGTEGARYLRCQLDQLSTENEQVQQWKKVSKMLSKQSTCSFPYNPSINSPMAGKGEDIIFEMMFIQDEEKKPCDRLPTNERARKWRKKMDDFLKSIGVDGHIACAVRRVDCLRGFNAMNQKVEGGSVQHFLTMTQVRQLFTALRSFVTGQVSDS